MYGKVDPLLYHHVTNIIVKNTSDDNRILFDAIECNVAIDNVNIMVKIHH